MNMRSQQQIREQANRALRDEISDATAFDHGETFTSTEDVEWYFKLSSQQDIFGDDAITDEHLLSSWADEVIENQWHCEFLMDSERERR